MENWNEVTLGSWTPSQLREQRAGCYSFLPALLVEGYMTELSKFEDPIGLIQGFMNQAGIIPSSKYRHTLESI